MNHLFAFIFPLLFVSTFTLLMCVPLITLVLVCFDFYLHIYVFENDLTWTSFNRSSIPLIFLCSEWFCLFLNLIFCYFRITFVFPFITHLQNSRSKTWVFICHATGNYFLFYYFHICYPLIHARIFIFS